MMLLAAACSILLLGSCGTSKNVQGSGSTSASHQKENATKGSDSRQVRRSRSWLSYRRFQTIRCIPRIL